MRSSHLAVQLGLALTLGLSLSSCNSPVAQVVSSSDQSSVEVAALTNLKVHFKNTSSWSKVNIHYWNTTASPTLAATTWPGVTMTAETGGWYSYTLPGASASNLLFVNGNTPTQKTPDLFRSNAEGWYVGGVWSNSNPDVVTPPGAGFAVHVKKPTTWGGANVHYWNTVSNPATPASTWPGTPMAAEGCGWYKYNFANASSTNLLFVDPNNTAQKTIDLSRNAEGWYDNGTWGTVNPLPTGALGNPSALTSSANLGGGTLNWTAPSDCRATGIKVYSKASSASSYTLASSLPASATSYSATGLIGGTAYDFKVVSVDGNNTESTGATTNLTPSSCGTGAPSDITGLASTDSSNTAFLNWTTSSDCRAIGYKIYSKTSSASTYTLLTSSALAKNVGNYTATGLTNGTVYNFKVVAVNAVGQESAGVVVNATPTQPVANTRGDFREESIYFVITSRFNDGDTSNNVACWDDGVAGNNGDPCWRGDFKGLIDKLDYIKALGFSAIWITPVVQNMSGYDYHGYHANNFKKVDPRYLSSGISYQTLIDEVHKRGMKVVQDIVLNHTGNFGEENLYPMFKKDTTQPDTAANILNIAPTGLLPANYSTLLPAAQYQARITAMKEDTKDTQGIYHHEKSLSWESYTVQTGQIAGDAVDLNTENPTVSNYLIDAYNSYIDMGVDAFRIDTVKHISRLTFNKVFNPAFKARGGQNFFMFGEVATRYRQVWNNGIPAVSTPFYTWAESQNYPWSSTNRLTNEASTAQHWNDNISTVNQPSSQNHYLNGNSYRPVNSAIRSGLDVIDFPMHWNFTNARDAFGVALGGDNTYSDATWNVTYVDSHDYAPDTAPENQRFNQPQDVWAENLSLMFSFRGIPTLYYGSEIEFKKGMVIDVGPNKPLEQTGRAYFGNQISGTVNTAGFGKYSGATGNLSSALEYPLAQHIRQLNLIRRAVPSLQKGQYSVDGVSGGAMAFKRRFTSSTVDSFALVAVSGDATFSGVPNGTYTDAVTGDVKNVSNGTLFANAAGKGNLRVYVLSTALTSAPGKVVDRAGLTYLK